MNLSEIESRLPPAFAAAFKREQLTRRWPQAHRSLMAACALVALWHAAGLAWLLLPTPKPTLLEVSPSALSYDDRRLQTAPIDIEKIRDWDLFGKVPQRTREEAAVDAIASAPQLQPLSTILVGLLYSSNIAVARAILRHKNKEDRYKVGDALPESNAVLESIQRDHVTVRRGEELITMRLFEKRAGKPGKLGEAKRTIDNSGNKGLNQLTAKYRNEILGDVSQLSHYLRFSPVRRNGEMIGYRIRARRNISHFRKMGFKNNDVITGLNGISLDSIAALSRLHTELAGSGPFRFHLLRAKKRMDLVLGLPQ